MNYQGYIQAHMYKKIILSVVCLTMMACDPTPSAPQKDYCIERVCRPTAMFDCYCPSDTKMVILPNGDVFCSCPDVGK